MDSTLKLNWTEFILFHRCDVRNKKSWTRNWKFSSLDLKAERSWPSYLTILGINFLRWKIRELYWVTFKVSFKFNWNTKAESCRVPRSFHYGDQLPWQNVVKLILVLCISDANIMVSENFLYSQGLIISIWFSNNNRDIFTLYTKYALTFTGFVWSFTCVL